MKTYWIAVKHDAPIEAGVGYSGAKGPNLYTSENMARARNRYYYILKEDQSGYRPETNDEQDKRLRFIPIHLVEVTGD
jgi:hypothetical protein